MDSDKKSPVPAFVPTIAAQLRALRAASRGEPIPASLTGLASSSPTGAADDSLRNDSDSASDSMDEILCGENASSILSSSSEGSLAGESIDSMEVINGSDGFFAEGALSPPFLHDDSKPGSSFDDSDVDSNLGQALPHDSLSGAAACEPEQRESSNQVTQQVVPREDNQGSSMQTPSLQASASAPDTGSEAGSVEREEDAASVDERFHSVPPSEVDDFSPRTFCPLENTSVASIQSDALSETRK